jgi:transcriptional regulator with XRE-family HTH domain
MTGHRQPEATVFGARLKELREQRGETQRSLAEAAGFSYPYIAEMESGRKVPSLTTLLRLAIALDCKIVELVEVFDRRDVRKTFVKSR